MFCLQFWGSCQKVDGCVVHTWWTKVNTSNWPFKFCHHCTYVLEDRSTNHSNHRVPREISTLNITKNVRIHTFLISWWISLFMEHIHSEWHFLAKTKMFRKEVCSKSKFGFFVCHFDLRGWVTLHYKALIFFKKVNVTSEVHFFLESIDQSNTDRLCC